MTAADVLRERLEFGRPVRVEAGGYVEPVDLLPGLHVERLEDDDAATVAPWRPMTGYSGQHGYAGPTMHTSEYVGGQLAADILATPGLYVMVESHTSEGLEECDADDDAHDAGACDCTLAGWAVLTIPDDGDDDAAVTA